ncbi:hypothetical protein MNBD_ALPHA12-384 [hydrothermal vent metagenome]|uniref:DUF2793 domain-containing protein n=1 Tax=hydrothermal vent metagenome TaxID=652676 RepID=A0A3B0TVS1_9ZZZZ
MANSSNLNLPYIISGQALKHITHNEALRALDAVVQLGVLDQNLVAPPASPAEGNRYIVATAATGAWAGKDNQIAAWQDGAWAFYAPSEGWLCWVANEDQLYAFSGTLWTKVSDSDLQNIPMLGVNATADAANRLTVSAAATLLTNEGAGHQLKINKNAAVDTASVLFQTNWSGRAEFGTTGDDDWHVKVSGDGAAWNEALIADKATGAVRFPAGMEHALSRNPVGLFLFTNGGDGTVSIYRNDVLRGQNPRAAAISAISSDVITLTTADASLFFDDALMNGVSYLRIWNISKSPEESAWVKASPANNQLQVLNSADISGWLSAETVQAGDPTAITPNRVMALDISPMLQNLFGAVFRQKGIICKSGFGPQTGFEPPRVYRRVKLSKGGPYDTEKTYPDLHV